MAEHSEALIPYPHNREIILRQKDSVVVYDPTSKSLEVRNDADDDLEGSQCPYCHQPLRTEDHDGPQSPRPEVASPAAAAFASPEYFRMLQHSVAGSEENSRPASPRRRLMHHLHSGTDTPPRNLQPGTETPPHPPAGSEFIGSSPAPQTSHGISSTAFSPNYFSQFFQEERELGRGGKGVVMLVKHVLDGVSLGHFALKRIPVGDDHQWLEKVLVEVQLLQHLSHQNLVSYRHVWLENFQISKFGPSVPCAFVLQQYCNMGDLHSYMLQGMETTATKEQLKARMRRKSRHDEEPPSDIASPRRLQFDEIRAFFKDITAGLNHLHLNNYIHRDLKPSNCLLHDAGKGMRVLVSDFGEMQSESQTRQSSGSTGTISYCAPEVLRIDPATGALGNFTTKSDVFSLGLILYFMSFARLPYTNVDHLHEENEDINLLRDEILAWAGVEDTDNARLDLPDKLFAFLGRLLSLDANERPTAEETLHAIKTGAGIDGFEGIRTRSSGPPAFDGLRRRSRFSSFEPNTDKSPPETLTHASNSSRRLSSPRQRDSPPASLDLSPRRRPLPGRQADSDASALDTSRDSLPSTGSLVLHPNSHSRHASPVLHSGSRHASPVKLSASSSFERLPAPPLPRFWTTPEFIYTLKVASLVFKIFSIYLLCQPVAARPDAGLVLLGVAVMDLLGPWHWLRYGPRAGVAVVLGLWAVHTVLLWGFWSGEMMCLPRGSVWDEV